MYIETFYLGCNREVAATLLKWLFTKVSLYIAIMVYSTLAIAICMAVNYLRSVNVIMHASY